MKQHSEGRVHAQLCAELKALPPLVSELHPDLLLHDQLVQQQDECDAGAPDGAHVGGGGDEISSDGRGHGDVDGDHDGESGESQEPIIFVSAVVINLGPSASPI